MIVDSHKGCSGTVKLMVIIEDNLGKINYYRKRSKLIC